MLTGRGRQKGTPIGGGADHRVGVVVVACVGVVMLCGLMEIEIITTAKDLLTIQTLVPVRVVTVHITSRKPRRGKACLLLTGNAAHVSGYDGGMEFVISSDVPLWQERTRDG